MTRTLKTWALAALCAALSAVAAHAEVAVFKNFSLVDTVGGRVAPNSAMVIDGGKIKWVGPAAKLRAPAGAVATDLGGKYVMPGLIDLHVHLGAVRDLTQDGTFYSRASVEKDLRQYAAYGVTTVQSLGTDGDAIFAIRADQRAGRPTFARVFAAGQGIVYRGGFGVPGINHPISTAAEAVAEVNAQADKGADFIKLWVDDDLGAQPKMPLDIARAVIDAAHRRHLRAVAHVFYLKDAKALVDVGVDGFAHMVRDQPVDDAFLKAMKARGVWQVAGTLSRDASIFAFGVRPAFLDDPFFRKAVSPGALALLDTDQRRASVAGNPHYEDYMRISAMGASNLRRMADAGVKIAFGTDSGPPARFAGYFAHWELEELVADGFSPAQALTMATKTAATWLGAKDLGEIAPGKQADFVVLTANPLVDIHNTHKISGVYIAGAPAGQ